MCRKKFYITSLISLTLSIALLFSGNAWTLPVKASELEEDAVVVEETDDLEDIDGLEAASEWLYEDPEDEDFPEINVFTEKSVEETDTAAEEVAGEEPVEGSEDLEFSFPTDRGLLLEVEIPEGIEGEIEIPDAETIRERASRKPLIKNESTYYYYYKKLTNEEKRIYKGIREILQFPNISEKGSPVYIKAMPGGYDFREEFSNAWYALMYDHPEFYFDFQSTKFDGYYYYYSRTKNDKGYYTIQFQVDKPYRDYEKEAAAINKATRQFINSLDLSQSDANIALQIHDRLLKTCSYNDYAYKYYKNKPHYARTIYNGLVTGDPVCSGYAFSFTYIMQQCGLKAIVVPGDAGPNKREAEPHMWNLVKIGAMWYEVDVTWDDKEPAKDGWNKYPAGSALARDSTAFYKATHYLFMVPTSYINNFKYENTYKYWYGNSWYCPSLNSVHIRYTDGIRGKAPRAYGKYYHQTKNCQRNFVVDDLVEDGQVFDDSNSRYLTKSDLNKLKKNRYYKADKLCRMARAEMYARRGFDYKNKWFKKFYSNYKWYKPKYTNEKTAKSKFNKYEKYNYKLILQFEKDNGYSWKP